MTIFESFLSFRAFGKRLEQDILIGLSRVIVVVLAVYLVFRLQDLWQRGNLHLAGELSEESVLFWGEIGIGMLLPMVLFLTPRIRKSDTGLFFASFLVVLGFILNRLDVSITGMAHSKEYLPKWTEIAVTAGIVAAGFVLFGLAVKHLPIFPAGEIAKAPAETGRVRRVFSGALLFAIWTVLLIGIVAFLMASRRGSSAKEEGIVDRKVKLADQEMRLPPDLRLTRSAESPGQVTFSHENHLSMQKEPDCLACHDGPFRLIKGESPSPAVKMHDAISCGKCHNGKDAFAIDGECATCHGKE
ncbi:MAG: hypothetical protein A2Z34_01925 [Planctomycetes bacterium RBG_16_59_8]|nr:MAG: hypothetical protein A2Z34_01925 [Planctomycetes bacterium RBG_16_59_8]